MEFTTTSRRELMAELDRIPAPVGGVESIEGLRVQVARHQAFATALREILARDHFTAPGLRGDVEAALRELDEVSR